MLGACRRQPVSTWRRKLSRIPPPRRCNQQLSTTLAADGSKADFRAFQRQFRKSAGHALRRKPAPEGRFLSRLGACPTPLPITASCRGKELSYNIADADAAWEVSKTFDQPACVIISTPIRVAFAIAADTLTAYHSHWLRMVLRHLAALSPSIVKSMPATAEAVSAQFLEVLIAPAYSAEAKLLAKKVNVRVLEVPLEGANPYDLKRVGGGLLVADCRYQKNVALDELRVSCKRQPKRSDELQDRSAWRAAKFVKSNTVCLPEMVRPWRRYQADEPRSDKVCRDQELRPRGLPLAGDAVAASDHVLPFRWC